MDVIVYGAGRLGKAIISAAAQERERGASPSVNVVAAVDSHLLDSSGADALTVPLYASMQDATAQHPTDVIIDSSNAAGLDAVLDFATSTRTPLVVAATGHSEEQLNRMRDAANTIPLLRSTNLSVGVNVLRRLTADATTMLGTVDTEIVEAHHRLKVDSPSGTALTLAEAVQQASDPRRPLVFGRRPEEVGARGNEIGVHAVRGGTVVGEHTVTFLLDDEIVELRHVAQSREVFGFGALKAAAFVDGKPAGFYTMEDLLG